MIISHERKFVFVKTTKTAGTSVEIALTKYCGPDDVITPIHPDDEAIKREKGLRGPQNDVQTLADGTALRLFNHAPGRRARRVIGTQAWRDYFTFAFERNPFDRVVSAWHYMKKNREAKGTYRPDMTLAAYIENENALTRLRDRGWGLYTVNDAVIVDKVYRFEELNDAMADIYDRLGIPDGEPLMQTKVSKREAGYRDYYDDATRKAVETAFARELDTFGYSF